VRVRLLAAGLIAVMASVPAAVSAQQTRDITGTVTDAGTRQPIQDATISAVGTTALTRTNERGQFRLRVPTGEVTLIARILGYTRATQRLTASQNTADFSLQKDVLNLEKVVITSQTTTLSTRNATTAVSVVDARDLSRAPAVSLEQQLQGKVLGAVINMNSGAPGGGGQIQIRGASSIIGNSQPLFVVDGVIISNDGFSSGANTITGAAGTAATSTQDAVVNRLADINPNDIESIEVLKSAAATALYGSRATNGVVVIRTKRGAAGTTRFSVTQRVGTQDMLRKLGHRQFSTVQQVRDLPYGNGSNPFADAYLAQAFPTGQIPASANIDNEGNFYNNANPSSETIMSLSGGSEKTQVFVQANIRNEVGLAPRTGAQPVSGRLNVDQTFSDRLKAQVSFNFVRNFANRGLSNNDNTATSPIYAFGYTPSVIDLSQKDAQGNFVANPFNGGGNAVSNPFQTFENITVNEQVWRQIGGLNLSYTALDGAKNRVTLSANGGFDRFNQDGLSYSPGFLQYEGNDGFVGRVAQITANSLNYNGQLNATWLFSGLSFLTATTTVSASYERQGTNSMTNQARGLLPGTLNFSQGQQAGGQVRQEFRDQALIATTQWQLFGEKLTLLGGVRADRSSTYGDRERWFSWPRASASYLFDSKIGPLDNIKFRTSWGEVGNRPLFTQRFLILGTGPIIGGSPSLVTPGTVNNPNIEPEKSTDTEFGTDISLFSGRVNFEGTRYSRVLTNQLFTAPVGPTTGVASLVINGGRLTNDGWELGLRTVPIQGKNLVWSSSATWQRNKQFVDQIPAQIPRLNVPGSFGAAYGRNVVRNGQLTTGIWGNVPVDRNTGALLPRGTVLDAAAGTFITRDTVLANSNPTFQMFFTNTVSWKALSLNLLVDWRNGGYVSNMTNNLWDEGGQSRDFDDPSPRAGQTMGQYRFAQFNAGDIRPYIQNGTNVRVRELSLSYQAPDRIASLVKAKNARVTLQGRNLWMRTDYWGYDPEFNNFGNTNLNRFIDLAPFPGVRQFFLSVDLGF
jgi:TonB-dependent starch-binding outer membrane protein SusC